MLVSSLIKELQRFNGDQTVTISYGGNGQYASIEIVTTERVRKLLDEKYVITSYSSLYNESENTGKWQTVLKLKLLGILIQINIMKE